MDPLTPPPSLLDALPPERYTILPNTAGCYSAKDAIRTCQLARELLDGKALVKLEVLGDEKTLFPHITETLRAAEVLIKDGFEVYPYCTEDLGVALRLADAGCRVIMPWASPIGSARGHSDGNPDFTNNYQVLGERNLDLN